MALADEHDAFRRELIAAGLLIPMGEDGLYGRAHTYERVVDGVDAVLTRAAAHLAPTRLRFPPILARRDFEDTDYIASFPDLTGAVFTFTGGNADHARLLADRAAGADWTGHLVPAGTFLTSAACHPIYPTLRDTRLETGRHFDVLGQCFRHEPAVDPVRQQAFRMKELVFVGSASDALAFRDEWLQRALDTLAGLQVPARAVAANDPFFGRVGRMLAANQRDQELKIELVVPFYESAAGGTAVLSGNYHQDHFGGPFRIVAPDGRTAHSACLGYGVDRIALALFRTHGLDPSTWPVAVQRQVLLRSDDPGDDPPRDTVGPGTATSRGTAVSPT